MKQHVSGASLAALRRWREVVAAHPDDGRALVAVAFRSLTAPSDGLVPLEAISAVVLAVQQTTHGPTELRFSAYGVNAVPCGVQWGSAANCRLSKSLRLRPRLGAKGRRFDLTRVRLLHVAMNLFEAVCKAEVHQIVDDLQLPLIWCGFAPSLVVEPDGPEVAGMASQMGLTERELMARCRREHELLSLYPLEFSGHEAEQARLYVEPATVPEIQIVQCDDSMDDLEGFRGAAAFDFRADVFRAPLVACDDVAL